MFLLSSIDDLNYKKDNHLLFIAEDFNTSLSEGKRKNINGDREDITSLKEEFQPRVKEVICF